MQCPDPSAVSKGPLAGDIGLGARVYRYFFYAWLFRDADSGSSLERSAALRHNLAQARWLPTYLLRWAVGGTVILLLEQLSERLMGDSLVSALLSAFLAVVLVFVVLFELVTAVCWAFLRLSRQSR
jgi:hypothetical protein